MDVQVSVRTCTCVLQKELIWEMLPIQEMLNYCLLILPVHELQTIGLIFNSL